MTDEKFFETIDGESNSIAIIVKHLAGNMRSRWTDFLTSDGEKPDRHRDQEFLILDGDTRASLEKCLEDGWKLFFDAVGPLQDSDLQRTVTIRGEEHTVSQALCRQIAHYSYHVGQIVTLARHLRGSEWKTLSIAKGKSEEFNPGFPICPRS